MDVYSAMPHSFGETRIYEVKSAPDRIRCEHTGFNLVYSSKSEVLVSEKVDHPSHYNAGKIEVIDAIEDWKLGFNLGNALKYLARAEHKNNATEDLKKAIWYLTREVARRDGTLVTTTQRNFGNAIVPEHSP